MKNERRITLVEILAVMVILAIIAIIAIPIFLQIINNSKADAHLANAQNVLESSKFAYTAGLAPKTEFGDHLGYKLSELAKEGYLQDRIQNPSFFSPNSGDLDVYDLEQVILSSIVMYTLQFLK